METSIKTEGKRREGKPKKNKVIIPPLKSQGIKTKLIPWINELIPDYTGKWIEPFLGTGVVAFNSKADEAILGDTNPHIIKLYTAIQKGILNGSTISNYLEIEGKLLKNAEEKGYAHYRLVRERFNRGQYSSYDFIFLSRAGFNGMMRFSKNGWNIPFCQKPNRFSQSYITKIVNQVNAVAKVIKPEPKWTFITQSFEKTINMATANDVIYCDPPYHGRYVDYFNGWSDNDEEMLFSLLKKTPAKFVLSTWHHNDFRKNEMIEKYWKEFNIYTRDHFYHAGGKVENRRSIVEALVCNFDATHVEAHNHQVKENNKTNIQMALQLSI
jgi:DNA adenine methylase